MNSPLFPPSSLVQDAPDVFIPQLPDKPTAQTSSVQVYIIPAEDNIFVEGFETHEYADRPPALLRGCLYVRVLKPARIKSITLAFNGYERTDWPEGIPPKRNTYLELNDIVSHTWPFYQQGNMLPNYGADIYQEIPEDGQKDVPSVRESPRDTFKDTLTPQSNRAQGSFLRSLSPSFMRRAVSPSPEPNELISVVSASDPDAFPAGDYIYNFEHALRPGIPESCSATFGEVEYSLEATVTRLGAFKSNITARKPVNIVRVPSDQNTEENEPIVITRDWEDQLRYDIVIGAKSVVLNSYVPLAFRFVPLWGKVQLHRIRVYLTENMEYYCNNKKVHRMEPAKKFLLLEHKAKKGESLLSHTADDGDFEVLPRELEFQLYVPRKLTGKHNHTIHPNTSLDNIQAHHWIKICLRISRTNPENAEKRKHYEISIDSPLRILSPLAAHVNTLLPAYDDTTNKNSSTNTNSSTSITNTNTNNSNNSNSSNSLTNSNDSSTSIVGSSNYPMNSSNSTETQTSGNNTNGTGDHDIRGGLFERPRSSSTSSILPSSFSVGDHDMHLESNLYAPEKESDLVSLSPQAVPHPDTFSPAVSPIVRPIHLLRKPSYAPPSFDADSPPAYTEQNRALSMSPLRLDEGGLDLLDDVNMVPAEMVDAPIKEMLRGQLARRRTSDKSIEDQRNREGEREMEKTEREKEDMEREKENIDGARKDSNANESAKEDNTQHSESNGKKEHPETVDDPNDPLYTSGPSGTRNSAGSIPSFHVQSPDSSSSSVDPMDVEDVVLGEDLVDYSGSPVAPMRPFSPMRRRTSSSSAISVPHEQTIPLLSLSSSSVSSYRPEEDPFHVRGYLRNGSINTLAYDIDRAPFFQTEAADLGLGGDLAGPDTTPHDLRGLRNPRLKKHYQDEVKVSGQGRERELESDELV